MAVDMFIKIGDLKGEAQDQKHKDEIDVLSWGDDEKQQPDQSIRIDGLNENSMRNFWNGILADANALWCTLKNNCSTTVANVLYNGGGDDLAGDWWTSHNFIWTPNKVIEYALSINAGIQESQQGPGTGSIS
jgi:hypothetical protein